MALSRSLLFYLGQVLATLVFAPLCILASPFSFQQRYFLITRWTVFNLWWLKISCGVYHEIIGLEHIPEKPGIIMCKHQSAWETLALQLIFIPQTWVLKQELLWFPFYGWALATMRPIVINRRLKVRALYRAVRQGCKYLKRGIWVIIFPEGTRVAPGGRQRYFSGGGLLAEKSGADITPVAHNAGYFWPRHSIIKRPGKITLIIGPVIRTEKKSANELTDEVRCWIEQTSRALPNPSYVKTT